MGRFARSRGKITLSLDQTEQELLSQSITEFIELLQYDAPAPVAAEPASDDPFEVWERSFGHVPGIEDDLPDEDRDPIIARLFPRAYPDDPEASSDFSRFTDAEQRRAKIEAAARALRDLGDLRGGTVRIHTDHLDAWLKTLNNLRLVLAVMLDINDEVSHSEAAQRPESDPRAWLYQFYGWLGWMLESLLECLVQGE